MGCGNAPLSVSAAFTGDCVEGSKCVETERRLALAGIVKWSGRVRRMVSIRMAPRSAARMTLAGVSRRYSGSGRKIRKISPVPHL